MNKRHLYILTACLSFSGLAVFLFKLLALGFPVTPDATIDVWNTEARISFQAQNKPVKVSMFIPRNTADFILTNDNFISRGYGLTILNEEGNKLAKWSIRKTTGRQTIYYKTTIRKIEGMETAASKKKPALKDTGLEGAYLTAAQELFADIQSRSADTDTLVGELLKRLNADPPDDNVHLLLGNKATALGKLEAAVKVLAQAGVPSRIVHGIRLQDMQRDAKIIQWLEVFNANYWISYDPESSGAKIPADYFPWWRGSDPLGQIKGGRNMKIIISVSRNEEAAIEAAIEKSRVLAPHFLDFSLFSLPLETQMVYRILLMIPFGALLIVIMRNIVGFKTFGTFMPILIALAFRETQLMWGVFLFSSLVAVGLSIRFYFERLKLLLVPRLASLLIVVILIMVVVSVLSRKLGLERGLSIALFPMVILTMTIERMSVVWEERGAGEALQQGLGSMVVAALGYFIMTNSHIEHFVFVYPEVLLIVLSITLLIGRYSGYRLWELIRFRAMTKGGP